MIIQMKILTMTKLNKNYWEERYGNAETGWDIGEISTPLKEYIDQLTDKSIKILIPGAGNSYEFDYLIANGFFNTQVVDFASQPIENLRKKHPDYATQLHQVDFFKHDDTYDLVLEQTFFCALAPNLRDNYVSKMHSLLKENGKLVGLLFDFPLTEVGPPFGGSQTEYQHLFEKRFSILTLEPARNSIKPREGRELFIIFEKK